VKIVSRFAAITCPRRRTRRRGSIVFEIALALAVAVAAMVLATTLVQQLRQRSRVEHFAAEVRTLSGALEARRQAAGKWPAAAFEGDAPEGIAAILPGGRWPAATPLGGCYVWTPPAGREPGTLSVTAFGATGPFAATRTDLRAIDALIDDGDLATGRFRTGFNGWPVWRVEP
jgi:type II secretory pathway pseudopilin PulG